MSHDYQLTYTVGGEFKEAFIIYGAASVRDAVERFERANPDAVVVGCNRIFPTPDEVMG